MIFKVDFEKAFDSVWWDFLDDVLRKFGFSDTWCKWIQCCLKSSIGSILVNGSPTEEFQFGKGLKQGDPLSPFLFILIMESLHLSFQRIVDAGMFHGIKLGRGLVNLSHMFYADEVVFVGQWCSTNITTLIRVLDCFHKASGLRINMSKSKIMGVRVDSERVNRAAMKLGCLVLKTPFTYLGSIVGGNMSRKQSWIETVDKIKKRHSKWKMNMLSIGGRLTLIKSVLGSTPLYHFFLFKVTMGVLNNIESLRSQFFNGHGLNSKKATWFNWKKALASKDRGGVIQALHGVNGRIGVASRGGYNSCWTAIIQETNSLLTKGGTLKDKFNRLYALESCKHVTVGTKFSQPLLSSLFRRTPRGGVEMDQFVKMVDDVKEVILSTSEDRWVWDLENTGEFSVSSIRDLIDEKTLPLTNYKTRWNKLVPIKVNILSWNIMTNSLPTRFNISCRGICIDSILCANCDKGVETSSHLFFSCSMARMVVTLILRWWYIPVVELDSYDDWTLWFDNVRLPFKNKKMLEEKTRIDESPPAQDVLISAPHSPSALSAYIAPYRRHDCCTSSFITTTITFVTTIIIFAITCSFWTISHEVQSFTIIICMTTYKRCRVSPTPALLAHALPSVPVNLLPPHKRFSSMERIETLEREVDSLTTRLAEAEIQIVAHSKEDIARDINEVGINVQLRSIEDTLHRR
nr:RNA-directed DNA polymerase, eukaryota [Tanacetum cinerariifolium]